MVNYKDETLGEVNQVYDGMINESDKFYQAQIDATKQWEEKQTQLQQERTDFTIEQIEQQKEQAQKDYTKEQSASYVDWQKQSNQYGANAESMASAGLTNTGYSESSQVSMYNTYQNRVSTARDVYNRAVLNYDNAIKDAQLQNNSILAEIAYNSLSQQLQLSLSGFQYNNELLLGKLDTKLRVDENYHNRYMDILGQINTENALAEDIRQFDLTFAEDQRQFDLSLAEQQRQFDLSFAEDQRQYDTSIAEQIRQYNESLAENRRQYNNTLAQKKTKSVEEQVEKKELVKGINKTNLRLGDVISKQYASELELNENLEIFSAKGKYYVVIDGDYVELTELNSLINAKKNSTGAFVKYEIE